MAPLQSLQVDRTGRLQTLQRIAVWVLFALFLKTLLAIVYEYRHYFPPDFDAAFLSGRRASFTGLYRVAFYGHILSGPIVLVLGGFLIWSGSRRRLRTVHRYAARIHMLLLFAALVPSGLVMSTQAQAGPIAGWGFAGLTLATAMTAAATVSFAASGSLQAHQRWAKRCFILLVSPLVLRLASGLAIVTQQESEGFYQANAWLSWLVPLAGFELWHYLGRFRQ